MKRDDQGRTKTERIVDEARRERRNAILLAALGGFVAGVLAALLLVDANALGLL